MEWPQLSRYPYIALDTETTGLQWYRDKMFGAAIALPDGTTIYEDVRSNPMFLDYLRDEVPKARKVVNQHLKFEMHMLANEQICLPTGTGQIGCTMIRAALIDEHLLTYDLDHLAKRYTGMGKDSTIYAELAELFGGMATKNVQMPNLQRAPIEVTAKYAMADALAALRLYEAQEPLLDQQELRGVEALEMRLLPVIFRMERRGVRVDIEGAERAIIKFEGLLDGWQSDLNQKAGWPINVNSSPQMIKLFEPTKDNNAWITKRGDRLESTEAGAPCFDARALESMRDPMAALVSNIRKGVKTKDTFLKGHILGHHVDGRVHTNFTQTKTDRDSGTGTGRLSCTDPALQQIHKRDKVQAAIVRALFLPDDRKEWISFDWAQIDFRCFAHYAKVPQVLAAYAANPDLDYHQIVADMTGLPRTKKPGIIGNSKQINLGLCFGMGEGKMAYEMGLPYSIERRYTGRADDGKKCKECLERSCTKKSHYKEWYKPGDAAVNLFAVYHSAVPGVKETLASASALAKTRGYVKTISGRRIRFPHGYGTHKSAGLVFQGTAADLLKLKLCEVDGITNNTPTDLLLNVHDEGDFSSDGDPTMLDRIKECMEDFHSEHAVYRLRVPVRASMGRGINWYEASKE